MAQENTSTLDLSDIPKKQALEALIELYRDDAVWGVRDTCYDKMYDQELYYDNACEQAKEYAITNSDVCVTLDVKRAVLSANLEDM